MKQHPLLTNSVIAILCITTLLFTAMVMHFDGVLIGAGVAAIAALGGYTIGRKKKT